MAVIALDLGATKLAGAIFQPDGNPVKKVVLSLGKRGGDEVSRLILKLIADQVGYARSKGMSVDALGCCVPGIVRARTGRVWAPNIDGWDDFPLLDRIMEGIQPEKFHIALDNDRACSIMGEAWQGSARGCRNVIFLSVGTGIGAGIMTDGKILRGSSDIAGSVGWLALNRPFREKYTSCGCFEYHASGDGLSRITLEYLNKSPHYSGILGDLNPEDVTAQVVFDAYGQHDPIAIKVMNQAVGYWGMAVANLVSLFNPEKIIFGGGVFGPAAMLLEDILKEARKWAQPVSIKQVKLETSSLGSDAGLFGAGFLALNGKSRQTRRNRSHV